MMACPCFGGYLSHRSSRPLLAAISRARRNGFPVVFRRKAIEDTLNAHAGEIDRQLASTRIAACSEDRDIIVDDYPLLPVRRRFWEHVLRGVDVPGTASQLRTQLKIVHEAVRQTAEASLGTVVPADLMYEQISPDLRKTGIVLREIDETIRHSAHPETADRPTGRITTAFVA